MAVTLRVYDGGKNFTVDRYTLYYPTPRNKQKSWGYAGMGLGFSFNDSQIVKCCHNECGIGIGIDYFPGKKIKRETLPLHIQKWIKKEEDAYNKAIRLDTQEAWDEFNEL